LILEAPGFLLRPWASGDEDALARHANNRNVWLNLRDRFPHPYTREDAARWIALCAPVVPPQNLAIAVGSEAVGGIGLERGADVYRRTAEVGYWLGESFWGRGIATAALRRFSEYAFETFDLVRLHAGVFEHNRRSARVLEKAGYTLEVRRRRAVFKDGRILDELAYFRLRGADD
jgi:RimJ/RimL family protein N-acetyltransferase